MDKLRNGSKGDSNPWFLDCESSILVLICHATQCSRHNNINNYMVTNHPGHRNYSQRYMIGVKGNNTQQRRHNTCSDADCLDLFVKTNDQPSVRVLCRHRPFKALDNNNNKNGCIY